mgnify:CR=1 FL=1
MNFPIEILKVKEKNKHYLRRTDWQSLNPRKVIQSALHDRIYVELTLLLIFMNPSWWVMSIIVTYKRSLHWGSFLIEINVRDLTKELDCGYDGWIWTWPKWPQTGLELSYCTIKCMRRMCINKRALYKSILWCL